MTAPLTAAERQAMRERHRPYSSECAACCEAEPCDAVTLLDTLDATEKELAEARRDGFRQAIEAVASGLESGAYDAADFAHFECEDFIAAWVRSLLPQPDAPAATPCGRILSELGRERTCIKPTGHTDGWCDDGSAAWPTGMNDSAPAAAAPRVTASGSWLAGTASIAGFCGECGLAAGSDGCAHGDGAA